MVKKFNYAYTPTHKQVQASKERKKHPVPKEVEDAVKALKVKTKAVKVKPGKGGSLCMESPEPRRYFVQGMHRTQRVMPPEYYLLSESAKKAKLNTLTAKTLYYCMSYLIEGVHWKGRIPDTEYWIMEMGLRLLVRLRDSECVKQRERYSVLLRIWKGAGGYSWSPLKSGKFVLPRQPGWRTRGARVTQISKEAKRGHGASGSLYWPETWDAPVCPECGSVRCVDALTNQYYCWNQLCWKSRWNTARNGRSMTSFTQAKAALVQGKNLLPSTDKPRGIPEAETVGQKLYDLLEHAGGTTALEMLKKKRI